ncbi:MAG: hypothetical protein MPN21_27885, partial [Thermoanaerobaculia bacterium]|nr:hypothetical protein [Thermoanaerobaculia bacterium]
RHARLRSMSERNTPPETEETRGPLGGKTTISKDGNLVRKSFFIDRDVDQALRDDAHRQRRSEATIVRELLRRHYGIED